jgi:hypothetical protein
MVHTKKFGVPFFKNPHEYPIGASRPGGGTINVGAGSFLIGEEFRHNVNPDLLKEYKGNVSEDQLRLIHDPKGIIRGVLQEIQDAKSEKAAKKAAKEAEAKQPEGGIGDTDDVDSGDDGDEVLVIEDVGEFTQEELRAWFKDGNGGDISRGELVDCADFLGIKVSGKKKNVLHTLRNTK